MELEFVHEIFYSCAELDTGSTLHNARNIKISRVPAHYSRARPSRNT
jgi:hypothetical protein